MYSSTMLLSYQPLKIYFLYKIPEYHLGNLIYHSPLPELLIPLVND